MTSAPRASSRATVFLCFAMGEVYASLIKSVSRSGGFCSGARTEAEAEQGRGKKGKEEARER